LLLLGIDQQQQETPVGDGDDGDDSKPGEEVIPVLSSGDDVKGQPDGQVSFSKHFPFFILTISVVQVTN